jgi:hypothetical protein
MSGIVDQWLLDHDRDFEVRADFIRAGAEAVSRHYDTIETHLRNLEKSGLIVKKGRRRGGNKPSRTIQTFKPASSQRMNIQGIPREQARLKHDAPARLEHRLSEFLDSMASGFFYEENTVVRACGVSKDDETYWKQITSNPRYTKFHGITEKGIRLWGLEDDMRWAAREMTGFARSM